MSAEVVPLPRKEPTLAPILNLTATAMNAVNATILDRMQSEIPLIHALAGHLIAGGGKRCNSCSMESVRFRSHEYPIRLKYASRSMLIQLPAPCAAWPSIPAAF